MSSFYNFKIIAKVPRFPPLFEKEEVYASSYVVAKALTNETLFNTKFTLKRDFEREYFLDPYSFNLLFLEQEKSLSFLRTKSDTGELVNYYGAG
jgi:hypothetical protein